MGSPLPIIFLALVFSYVLVFLFVKIILNNIAFKVKKIKYWKQAWTEKKPKSYNTII